jgi:hypothetical protein
MSGAIARADSAESKEKQSSRSMSRWRQLRAIALAAGALAMAVGLWTGLVRLGVALPGAGLSELHGALMICGFLGTVISLERAVALAHIPAKWIPVRRQGYAPTCESRARSDSIGTERALGGGWPYAAPLLSCAGTIALLAGMPSVAALTFLFAGIILLLASASIVARQPALFTIVLAIGAACWGAGTLQWLLGYAMPAAVGWWLNFLVLTIAAERLELSRLTKPLPSRQITFAVVIALLLLGSARGELAAGAAPFTAAGLLGCSAWLLRYDLARRTVHSAGQPRFAAISILAGHVWLGIAGILLLVVPPGATAFSYDAAVHAIAIGFVLSMIFGHAPIILPAVLGIRLRYGSFSYVPLALLHASVILRVAGDLLEWVDLRTGSAVATIVALVAYGAHLAIMSWKADPQAA